MLQQEKHLVISNGDSQPSSAGNSLDIWAEILIESKINGNINWIAKVSFSMIIVSNYSLKDTTVRPLLGKL